MPAYRQNSRHTGRGPSERRSIKKGPFCSGPETGSTDHLERKSLRGDIQESGSGGSFRVRPRLDQSLLKIHTGAGMGWGDLGGKNGFHGACGLRRRLRQRRLSIWYPQFPAAHSCFPPEHITLLPAYRRRRYLSRVVHYLFKCIRKQSSAGGAAEVVSSYYILPGWSIALYENFFLHNTAAYFRVYKSLQDKKGVESWMRL